MQKENKIPLWLQKERQEIIDAGKNNGPTREEYDKINEAMIRSNPALGKLNERVVYDKEFLLEVQAKGYNPLDNEDVQNYLEQKPPKDLERNLKLCGADKYTVMGQSEFDEDAMEKFLSKTNINISLKKPEDIYLSDISGKKQKDYLLEDKSKENLETYQSIQMFEQNEFIEGYTKHKESEDDYRKNLAKAFGSEDMKINKKDYNISDSKELKKSDNKTEKVLELIKELRALGFSPDEIKKEIQRFH